jgi:hypothetical protein
VARTPTGNVYAGADGNVYRHTDNGWSKWNNGWQSPSGARTQGNLTSTGVSRFSEGGSRTMPNSNYQQLDQDRFARSQGGRQYTAPSGGRFSGGGERFRR